ncbi:hypothetical protein FB446DRAFT_757103 [Lentinula raphanica]|nr:hypothetical protein FB446DRAFT_757103 [Lentinula raphanica]
MTRLAFHTILLIGAASSAFGAPTPSPPPLAGALQAGSQIPANSGISPELNIMALEVSLHADWWRYPRNQEAEPTFFNGGMIQFGS